MRKYAIVDIETNGRANRITEIAIIVYNGQHITNEYQTLINPGGRIPPFITALTGISQEMLWDQPTFAEVADDIEKTLADCVFVAHNVNFDYKIIKSEFENVGRTFKHPKLCSVRLSRKIIPGHRSYSLGNICTVLGISNQQRHRAYGDALATLELIQHMQQSVDFDKVVDSFLNQRSKEATLPSNLEKNKFEQLPTTPGIYKFYNKQLELIYVGKAKNIKQRVMSHFYSKSRQKINMLREIADVDYELSGSEMLAYLMEDATIKKKFPKYNKASKQRVNGYALVSFRDRRGVIHLGLQPLAKSTHPIKTFFRQIDARLYVQKLAAEFNLCAKYCHLIENNESCEHSIYSDCLGICKDEENVNIYNDRVKAAINKVQSELPDGWIKLPGRTEEENAFVRIKEGKYCGYGFIDMYSDVDGQNLDDYLIPEKDNLNVQKILESSMSLVESLG